MRGYGSGVVLFRVGEWSNRALSQIETAQVGGGFSDGLMGDEQAPQETYSPWTIVDLVFSHLVNAGLHPTLGSGHPGEPAAALLRALGIVAANEGDTRISQEVRLHLAQLRATMFDEP